MLNLSLTLLGLIVLGLVFLLWSYYRTDSFKIIMGITIPVLMLVYGLQPDLWHWYRDELMQKRLRMAQAIFKDPHRIQQLKVSLQTHLKQEPKDIKAWILLARLHASSDEWLLAQQAIRHAYQLHPEDIKIDLLYVETLWHVEGYLSSQSRKILLDILKKEPMQPDALMLLATEARQRHCPNEALAYLKILRVVVASDAELKKSLDEAILNLNSADDTRCSQSVEPLKH